MDYRDMLRTHIESKADATIAGIPVTREQAKAFGIMRIADSGRVEGFLEKPQTDKEADIVRMVVVPYYPLADDVIRQIIKLQLSRIADRFRQNHKAEFVYDDAVIEAVRNRCREVESGARNVDSILTGKLLPEISRQILGRMAEGQGMTQAKVSVDKDGNFQYQID